jgi:hypothetical protein
MKSRIVITAAMAIVVAAVAYLYLSKTDGSQGRAPGDRSSQEFSASAASAVSRPAPHEEVARSPESRRLHDQTLLDIIQNAKVAARKGDKIIRRAMVEGLKKSPNRSKELIDRQIEQSEDQGDVAALRSIRGELP